jgi:hypothetical protein
LTGVLFKPSTDDLFGYYVPSGDEFGLSGYFKLVTRGLT